MKTSTTKNNDWPAEKAEAIANIMTHRICARCRFALFVESNNVSERSAIEQGLPLPMIGKCARTAAMHITFALHRCDDFQAFSPLTYAGSHDVTQQRVANAFNDLVTRALESYGD